MFQEAATVLNPAWAPPAEIVTGGRRGGSVAIGLRVEEGGSCSSLVGMKLDKLMGISGQAGSWMLLPQSLNAKLGTRKKSPFPFLFTQILFIALLPGIPAGDQDTWALPENDLVW